MTSEIKEREPVKGRQVSTRVSKLFYQGALVMILEGPTSDFTLKTFAEENNRRNTRPVFHQKAFADLPEGARNRLSAKHQKNTCGPEFTPPETTPLNL